MTRRNAILTLVLTGLATTWSASRLPEASPGLMGVAAALCYVVAHGIRALRIVTLLGDRARGFRAVLAAQFGTVAVSGMLPFKTGEVVRILALGAASRGPAHGLVAVWLERSFDALVWAVVGAAALFVVPEARGAVGTVWALALAFLFVTLALVWVLPENLVAARRALVNRPTRPWIVPWLARLAEAGAWSRLPRRLLDGRVGTLLVSTVALWTMEAAALAFLIRSIEPGAALGALLHVLAGVVIPTGGGFPPTDVLAAYALVAMSCWHLLSLTALGSVLVWGSR